MADSTPEPSAARRELWDDYCQAHEAELGGIHLRAMVLGPRINESDPKPGAQLRKAILERSPGEGITVWVRPEERELVKAAKKLFGKNYNLCRYELGLAQQCHLIVILPDSPGSFAELGLFAWQKSTCQKSLILFNKKYKGGTSYLMHGPRRASIERGATIGYVDYADIEQGWKRVVDFASKIRQLEMDDRIGV